MIRSWGFVHSFNVPMIRYLGFVHSFDVAMIWSLGFVDLFGVPMIRSLGFVYSFDVLMIRSLGFVYSFDVPMILSLGFVDSFDLPMIQSLGFVDFLNVLANARDDWTAWGVRLEDPIFRVLCLAICMLWLDRLEDPLFRIPLRSLFGVVHVIHCPILPDQFLIRRSSRDSPSDSYLRLFLVDLVEQYITRWSNITVQYARSVVTISIY